MFLGTEDCQERSRRNVVQFRPQCRKFCSQSSVRPVGATRVDCQRFITHVFLKASSGTRELGRFYDQTWAAETAASFMGSGVSGSHERRSIKFRLRHSGLPSDVRELPLRSSPESVFVFARLRLSPPSSFSVVVRGGLSRGRRLSVRYSTSRVQKPPCRACSQCVRCSAKCDSIQPMSSLLKGLCCVVMSTHN